MAKIEYNIPSERIPLISTVALQLCPYFLFIISTPDILSALLATAACLLMVVTKKHRVVGVIFKICTILCRSQPKVEIE